MEENMLLIQAEDSSVKVVFFKRSLSNISVFAPKWQDQIKR